MKLIYWAFAAALVVVAVLFALSNRQIVEFGFWPLPYIAEVPAYGFGLGAFGCGFLCGGFLVWLRGIGARGRARADARRVDRLQREGQAPREHPDVSKNDTENRNSVVAISNPPDSLQPDSLQKAVGAR